MIKQIALHPSVQTSVAAGAVFASVSLVHALPWPMWAAWAAVSAIAVRQAVRA